MDYFGSSVAIDGETIVVGASGEASNAKGVNNDESDNSSASSGAAYVFTLINGQWQQQAYLKASNTNKYNLFGSTVKIFGDTIAISAPLEKGIATGVGGNQESNYDNTINTSDFGAVYIFQRNNGTWQQNAYIKSMDNRRCASFGYELDLDLGILVVSQYHQCGGIPENSPPEVKGKVFMYEKVDGTWRFESELISSKSIAGDAFGSSVEISGSNIAVGAIGNDLINGQENHSGSVFVFSFANNQWSETAYIKSSKASEDNFDFFGQSIALSGGTLIVGAPEDSYDKNGNTDSSGNSYRSGAVFVFTRQNNQWIQSQYIKASNGEKYDGFGTTVALSNQSLVIGAPEKSNSDYGASYLYENNSFGIQVAHTALWYNPEQNGHGINVQILENNRLLMYWYVYDSIGQPLWLIGIGDYQGNTAYLNVSILSGAKFPPNFDTNDVNMQDWGTMELEFSGCNNGTFKWTPLANDKGYTAGEMPLVRLTNTLGLECSE